MRTMLGPSALFGLAAFAAVACARNTQDSNVGRPGNETAIGEDRALELHRMGQRPGEELRDSRESGAPRAIGGGPRDREHRFSSTVARIAGARCDREVRCGHVGPSETFASREACVSKTESEKRADINLDDCMLGVSQPGLSECLRAIRDEDCGNPLDTATLLRACRTGNVCLK
jgi:Family of unknown function (DUF6184)